jgi:hypothetical protein
VAIYRLMRESGFGPKVTARMALAYDMALRRIGAFDPPDFVAEAIASRIVELARTGEQSSAAICDRAIKELGAPGSPLHRWRTREDSNL